eukprot:gene5861-4183_t
MFGLLRDIATYLRGHRYAPPIVYLPEVEELPAFLLKKFEPQHSDKGTEDFLRGAARGPFWKYLVARVLYPFFSFTNINGLLSSARMYVVSTEQLRVLLRPDGAVIHKHKSSPGTEGAENAGSGSSDGGGVKTKSGYALPSPADLEEDPEAIARLPMPQFGSILDIGSGDGNVTAKMIPLLRAGCTPADICCSEISSSMRWRLQQRGFTVVDCADPYHDPATGERRMFDLITCFNILDRIDTPQTMLNAIRDSLNPGGLVLLAVVLPWCPFVETGSRQKKPKELLPMKGGECCRGASYEASLTKLVENVLIPTGFEIVRWTRLPYLCEGDLVLKYAVLYDAVLIMRRKEYKNFYPPARPPGMKGVPPVPPHMRELPPLPPSMRKTVPPPPPPMKESASSAPPYAPPYPGHGGGRQGMPPPPPPPPPPPSRMADPSAPGGGGGFLPGHLTNSGGGGAYDRGAPPPPPPSSMHYAAPPPPLHGGDRDRDRGRGRRDRGSRGDDRRGSAPTNTVWAGNLDPSQYNEEMLRQIFAEFGVVMRIAPHFDHSYCFVHFRRVEEAVNAVNTLRERGVLGATRFNYGKMYEYTDEEMQDGYTPPDPSRFMRVSGASSAPPSGSSPAPYGQDRPGGPPPRRGREEANQKEPTNVLWVGSLPEFISDERLTDIFSPCGTVKFVSRMERGNMAFVHFETVEECTLALETMRGKPVDQNVVLALNYGHAQRPKDPVPAGEESVIGPHETPTNVVYLGQIPPNATDADIDNLFEPFPGFINAKYVSSAGIGFGHFDSVETARTARIALHNAIVCGVPIRVNFGKSNHSFTMADKGNNSGSSRLDDLMRAPPGMMGPDGTLIAFDPNGPSNSFNALTLPAMGSTGNDYEGSGGGGGTGLMRERAPPELSLRARLQSVMGSTYNGCGAQGAELPPSVIQSVCIMVDRCEDEATSAQLDETLLLYLPVKAVHLFNVVTKRVREFYAGDPIRKLWVLFSITRAMLRAAQASPGALTSAALNAYLMVLLVCSEGQSREGVDRLITIMDSLERHAFLQHWCNVTEEYKESFRTQLKEIRAGAEGVHDLTSLLSRRRRRTE